MDLRLHFLEAGGALSPWRPRMEIEAEAVSRRIDALVARPDRKHPVDVVVRRARGLIIPELGLGGACYEQSVVTIAVAPESENFEASFQAGVFGSTLAHELHHALRHAACGYGSTLGEAIVSEGLADRFATEVTGCPAPIWTIVPDLTDAILERARGEADSFAYDHTAWFFGRGDLPRWAGYAIGWRLVDAYLAEHEGESAASLVGVAAGAILDGGRASMKGPGERP